MKQFLFIQNLKELLELPFLDSCQLKEGKNLNEKKVRSEPFIQEL